MKTAILAAVVAFILGASVAQADPPSQMMPQQNDSQYNWTAGGAGWG
jgi:hypothetical protein